MTAIAEVTEKEGTVETELVELRLEIQNAIDPRNLQ